MTLRVSFVSATALVVAVVLAGCATADPITVPKACRMWKSAWSSDDMVNARDGVAGRTSLALESLADEWVDAGASARVIADGVASNSEELGELLRLFADEAPEAAEAARAFAADTDSKMLRGRADDARREMADVAEAVTLTCLIDDLEE